MTKEKAQNEGCNKISLDFPHDQDNAFIEEHNTTPYHFTTLASSCDKMSDRIHAQPRLESV
jgi:hypothetical protein